MIRLPTSFRLLLAVSMLATCLSCSKQSTPVRQSVLIGKWQQIDKPGISLIFVKDGAFSVVADGQRITGGKYQLINDGNQIILDFDIPKAVTGTNTVFFAGDVLNIKSDDGNIDAYKRVE